MSIADPAPFDDQLEGTLDIDPLLFAVKQSPSRSDHVFSANLKVRRIVIYSVLLFVSSINGVVAFYDDALHVLSALSMVIVSLIHRLSEN